MVDQIKSDRELRKLAGLVPRDAKRRPSYHRTPVGRSSVAGDNPTARLAGSEQAGRAVEPEFVTAAYEAVVHVGRAQGRLTSDDIWDWLDEREHFTEHPKAIAALLRRFIKEKLIRPVPDGDPDSHRPSRRSNQSRTNRVYVYTGHLY